MLPMLRRSRCRWFRCVLRLIALFVTLVHEGSFQERPPCIPGFYCPLGSVTPVPCPKGTYGPTAGAESTDNCLKCPPHHYCPRPGLLSPLLCGPVAQQPLSGQDSCVCPGQGQQFQAMDGQCRCTTGYQPTNNGDVCVHKVYDVCRDGKTRTQYGDCLDRYQWLLHCREQVCQSADDYQGYDGELGLCVCRQPPGRSPCDGSCRRRPAAEVELQCRTGGVTELVHNNRVSPISGSLLKTVFQQWDSRGSLLCGTQISSSHLVYIVQTTGAGFFGLLDGTQEVLREMLSVTVQPHAWSSDVYSGDLLEIADIDNVSQGIDYRWVDQEKNKEKERKMSVTGILNPAACFHLSDVILFTVDTRHYPLYDLDNLYNTNSDFDWGAFRKLEEQLSLSWTPPRFFSVVLTQPGVYVFKLSSHPHRHMYVRVMPAGGRCFEPGPFFPPVPRHMTRLGIKKRSNLLLRPDWLVTGGLLFGAAFILCTCVSVLILFTEYGWPEKKPIRVRYRLLQSAFHMEDFSSKGSRLTSLKRMHRNQLARMTEDSNQPVSSDTLDEFWDYEHQVDLEAFSSSTFYSLLLQQSQSVTVQLGRLTAEVRELYKGALGKLQQLYPFLVMQGTLGEGDRRIRMEVEKEAVRRKNLGSQLKLLLDRQLEVLRREQCVQQRVHSVFMAHLTESIRLEAKEYHSDKASCRQHQHIWSQKLTSMVNEMGEQISAECQRQGAWELLGEGVGAKLLCPDTGTVLTKNHFFDPDGSLRACRAVHRDPVTGLIRPKAHSRMLLSSGHTMTVPPDFFLHPHTGRVMPIAGSVAYDPTSSALVLTRGSCTGDNRKWDIPLIPFIPYPTSQHSAQPLSATRLRGLRPGQRLQLGVPMLDPDTGVPVPILAVTIHPQTGLVYPLGGLHICPITSLTQPIQIGFPMLDSRTGKFVLTVGVSLDPVTGAVVPVGGVMLAESFIEPLSGRMVRIGGASMRAGQMIPNAGGYQALLESKVLASMFKIQALLKSQTIRWESQQTSQQHPGTEGGNSGENELVAAAEDLREAWGRSLNCQLQLQARLELLLDWAICLQQDGGILGEMPLPDSGMPVPALLGMEYPDPVGSGLSVPVLGFQTDLFGTGIPLAGTMEDPSGKGLVAIRYGSQTIDPVTGALARVVGARLDAARRTVIPVTVSYWQAVSDQPESVHVDALQREACARNTYWQQQRKHEDDFLSDLDSAVAQSLFRLTESNPYQWSGRQLREAALEQQDLAQTEAQRRATGRSRLALVLPPPVLRVLMLGDEEEWNQQCSWNSALLSSLDKLDVSVEQLQQEQEKWITQGNDWPTTLQAADREMRQKELWERSHSRRVDLEATLNVLRCVRQFSQLCTHTALAVLRGNFCYREYGLLQPCVRRHSVEVMGSLQQIALPLLERLNQLLEDKVPASFSPNPGNQTASGLSTKQACDLETNSRVWTASVPAVKGISPQSPREPPSQTQDASSAPADICTTSSGARSQVEVPPTKDSAQHSHLSIPDISEEEWSKLLDLSPLFQTLKELQLQLEGGGTALLGGGKLTSTACRSSRFIDVLDAQWECEGELIPLDPSVLHSQELLVYEHGRSLITTMSDLNLTPVISLQIAASLPKNNYVSNAFRNSFFYQEAEETLFVRRQRLRSVGGFTLLLLHCLSHVQVKDLTSDSSPAFQRLFFKVMQECLGVLVRAGLDSCTSHRDVGLCMGPKGLCWGLTGRSTSGSW